MNKKDSKPDYKKLYSIARDRYLKTKYFHSGPFDETYYTLRVYESSKEIIKMLKSKKVDKNIVLTASILHDIGKTKLSTSKVFGKRGMIKNAKLEWYKHAKLGKDIARRILKEEGHSLDFIDKVCFLIENHDKRGKMLKEKSIELQILQDADLLADCGFAGFIRPFLYSGMFNHQGVIDSIKYIEHEDNRVERSNLINLKTTRILAKKKMNLQRELVKNIKKDIRTDLF
ncbi:MAG: HD domain-containing protein [Nanoarchaeota archaeon]